MRTIPGLPQGTERDARTGSGTEKCRTFFCRGKEHHRENTDTLKKSRRGAFPVGRHPRRFFSLYSSFSEQCACYPYIFPTIFPRAAAGRSLHSRLRNLYCAPATLNDRRLLFLHNTGDVPSNACRVHAVLLVMLHLTDAPGDAPAVFIVAENAFLTCFCKSGADVTQFYDGNMDAVGLDFVCKSVRIRRNSSFARRVEGLERNVCYGGNGADVHNMPLPLTA